MQPAKLTITMGPQGLQLQASTQDPLVLYGLLKLAEDALQEQRQKAAAGPGIEVAGDDLTRRLAASKVHQ